MLKLGSFVMISRKICANSVNVVCLSAEQRCRVYLMQMFTAIIGNLLAGMTIINTKVALTIQLSKVIHGGMGVFYLY